MPPVRRLASSPKRSNRVGSTAPGPEGSGASLRRGRVPGRCRVPRAGSSRWWRAGPGRRRRHPPWLRLGWARGGQRLSAPRCVAPEPSLARSVGSSRPVRLHLCCSSLATEIVRAGGLPPYVDRDADVLHGSRIDGALCEPVPLRSCTAPAVFCCSWPMNTSITRAPALEAPGPKGYGSKHHLPTGTSDCHIRTSPAFGLRVRGSRKRDRRPPLVRWKLRCPRPAHHVRPVAGDPTVYGPPFPLTSSITCLVPARRCRNPTRLHGPEHVRRTLSPAAKPRSGDRPRHLIRPETYIDHPGALPNFSTHAMLPVRRTATCT